MRKSNKIISIIQWAWVIFCIVSAIAAGPSLAAAIFVLAGVLVIPFKSLRKFFKNKLKIKSGLAIFLSIILFIVGMVVIPTGETDKIVPGDESNQSTIVDTETETKPDSITDVITNGGKDAENLIGSLIGNITNSNDKDTSDKKPTTDKPDNSESNNASISLSDIPEFKDKAYVTINNNQPKFNSGELTTKSFEKYSDLDNLGRCGVVYACLSEDTMPAKGEERGSISHIYPSGWKQAKYDIVNNKYLYNRCHLIGWQLSAENDNKKNLITGTRYFNTEGMLPFENMVADYIHETGNHVMYRVTPIYNGKELVARGVQIEAYSVEDKGDGICFNVYCYNNQPGITINYSTGESWLTDSKNPTG